MAIKAVNKGLNYISVNTKPDYSQQHLSGFVPRPPIGALPLHLGTCSSAV